MANICKNTLKIIASAESFEKLINLTEDDKEIIENGDRVSLSSDVFSLEKFIPGSYKEGDEFTQKDQDWRMENWGVKWDIDETELVEYDEEFIDGKLMVTAKVIFETPWGVPKAGLMKISEKFSDIDFSMISKEDDLCFAFFTKYQNGEVEEVKLDYDAMFQYKAEIKFENLKVNDNGDIEFNVIFDQKKDMEDPEDEERHYLNVDITIKKDKIESNMNKSFLYDEYELDYDENILMDFGFNDDRFSEVDIKGLVREILYDNAEDLNKVIEYAILNNDLGVNKKTMKVKKI